MGGLETLDTRGWLRFDADPAAAAWATAARPAALAAAADPGLRRDWLRCGGTWFVGVHVLENGEDGSVGDVPLAGAGVDFARGLGGGAAWDRAQVSVCYRGYPKPWSGESEAALRYRVRRDAAHVDGVLKGADGRRRIGEYHRFLMGLALTSSPAGAAPFVVWEGSHRIMAAAFAGALAGTASDHWHEVDVTDAYTAARRQVFDTCPRVEVPQTPGEVLVVHRHLLHGVAPWPQHLDGPAEGRAIAYFRPEGEMDRPGWLGP